MLIRGLIQTRPIVKLKLGSYNLGSQNLQKFSSGASNSSFKITKLLRDDHNKLTDFLLKNFYVNEPMGVVLGLNVQTDVANWFHKYVKKHLQISPQVTSQAVDGSGKIIGVNFAVIVDPRKPRPPLMIDYVDPDTQPTMAQITRFLDEIEEGIDACEFLGLSSLSSDDHPTTLDNINLSVDKKYWRQGLSFQLIQKSEEFAQKYKECRAGRVVVTSEFSYRAFLKCEYQMIREFQYDVYHDAQQVPIFKGKESKLGIHNCARVMIKQIK